eukprot:2970242-Pleurochrysis_carterae.AAC.1
MQDELIVHSQKPLPPPADLVASPPMPAPSSLPISDLRTSPPPSPPPPPPPSVLSYPRRSSVRAAPAEPGPEARSERAAWAQDVPSNQLSAVGPEHVLVSVSSLTPITPSVTPSTAPLEPVAEPPASLLKNVSEASLSEPTASERSKPFPRIDSEASSSLPTVSESERADWLRLVLSFDVAGAALSFNVAGAACAL